MKSTLMTNEDYQKLANSIARKNRHGRATKIIFGIRSGVVDGKRSGYRKCTTGQYVPNAYRNNFGWKNTYYQYAECVVELPSRLLLFKKFEY